MGLELKVENLGGHGPVQYLARTPWIRYAGDKVRARDIIHPSTPSPPEAQQTAILRTACASEEVSHPTYVFMVHEAENFELPQRALCEGRVLEDVLYFLDRYHLVCSRVCRGAGGRIGKGAG